MLFDDQASQPDLFSAAHALRARTGYNNDPRCADCNAAVESPE